jgi:hypothetical protein
MPFLVYRSNQAFFLNMDGVIPGSLSTYQGTEKSSRLRSSACEVQDWPYEQQSTHCVTLR